jgi:predicted ABC-type ATPase
MKPHIIFEGENGAGKTTLIKRIQAEMPEFLYHHFTFPLGETNEQKISYQEGQFRLMFDFLRQLDNTDTRFIFDRSHIGENYWSLKFRNHRPTYVGDLELQNKDLPIHIFNIVAEDTEIHHRLTARGEEANLHDIAANQCGIMNFCRESNWKVTTINTSQLTIDECVEKIKEALTSG